MNKPLPRIRDVALAAGVSTATVSRALSHPEQVSRETRERVLAAIDATGYTINHAARNLRRRRTGAIVVLVPNLANPFFSKILSAIAAEIAPAGYNVLVADTAPQGQERDDERMLSYLNNNRADGLILLDGHLPDELRQDIGGSGSLPPLVFACEWIEGLGTPSVVIDNAEGARLAIRHLAELGHRRIAHIMGPPTNALTIERRRGTLEGLAQAGIPAREEWFLPGDFTMESGAAAAHRWLACDERPTGVFCQSDEMAFGFISELHRKGLAVPQDVSVVGFDDIETASRYVPSLTTVRQPRDGIGTTAARMLLALMARGDEATVTVETDERRLLPVELVVRESTQAVA